MEVLCYQSPEAEKAKRFEHFFDGVSSGYDCRLAGSIHELIDYLKKPGRRPQAAVFWVADREELEQLAGLEEDLSGVKNILLLPDLETETVGRALCLRPCFYAANTVAPETVLSVLQKIDANS